MTDPIDEDYLLEFAREQQRVKATSGTPYVYDKCPVCRHYWHGVKCDSGGCDCRTSCEVSA